MRIYNKIYNVESSKKLKIAHISDIHYTNNYKIKRLDLLLESIKKNNPNYICIVGDLIDSSDINNSEIDVFVDWLKRLSDIAEIIVVLGNHDVEYIEKGKHVFCINNYFLDKIESLKKVHLLRNTSYKKDDVVFLGYEPYYEYYRGNSVQMHKDINKLLKQNDGKISILLVHDPDVVFLNKERINFDKLDLIICGHTHGGLMPEFAFGHRGIISPQKSLFKDNMRGVYYFDNTTLIISSGVIKLSKRSHLSMFNDIYSSYLGIIVFKNR